MMGKLKKNLELLSPAKDSEHGIAAINCGADAVYIGPPKFGARAAAGNTLQGIESLINYAHKYWAKVYVTINTLIYDNEFDEIYSLINKL
jgi:23S rRNA 5-hydroxycytidine C2501 synthase